MDHFEVGSEIFGVGEPHVAHGAVVGLDSSVAHQMVLKLVPAVEDTAANLVEDTRRFSQLEKENGDMFQTDNNSNQIKFFLYSNITGMKITSK